MANEDWDQIELQDDPEACTVKATIQRLEVQKEPLDLADPLTLTVNKIRQDYRIKADFVKLRKTLNVAKKEKEPRISQLALSEAERGLRGSTINKSHSHLHTEIESQNVPVVIRHAGSSSSRQTSGEFDDRPTQFRRRRQYFVIR